MFHTKKDLDKHVRSSLSRLRDNEKNLRGYTIAKLYFKINEYKTAEHWVSLYLSANDNCAAAHKLRGQCFEKLKKPEQQLLAYQRSLELDKKQTDLLIEVCKLLQMDELSGVTAAKARYWYELAESRSVQHEAVLNLKLKFLNDGANQTVHEILLKEIMQRPLDIGLHIRLVRNHIEHNRIGEAFKYAYDIEMKQNPQFRNSIDWYATVTQALAKYKAENESHLDSDWPYWLLLISTLDRHVFLSLAHTSNDSADNARNLAECVNFLFELDQALNKVVAKVTPNEPDRELATEFSSHFRGQFCLHAATLLFKRELVTTARNQWRETTKVALPLLLLAYNFGRVDRTQPWLVNATKNARELIALWSAESQFRCAQAGRTLLSCIDTQSENTALNNLRKMINEKLPSWSSCDDVLNEIRRSTTDADWRKKLYRQLFTGSEHQSHVASSHFVKSTAFEKPEYIWPQISELHADEESAQVIEPSSLARLVYLALGYDATVANGSTRPASTSISPDVRCRVFKDLNFSISNLVNCSAETLNQLDIDTFLYAAAIQAKRKIDVERLLSMGNNSVANKPRVLPYANMTHRLCTEEQANWWTAAYKVYYNLSGDELAELRATLQYGIEAVRGFNGPRMDLIILLKLGQVFVQRAQETSKTMERGFLEARSEVLFKHGLSMLRTQNDSRIPFRRLFKYETASSQFEVDTEISSLAEEAITFLADRYFKNKEYEECIDALKGIHLPFATYFQAEAYRKMTELTNTPKKSKRVYLDHARECLSETLELLDSPNVDKNHPLKAIVDVDIKRLHMESRKIETNQSMSDSFVSANGRSDLDDSVVRVQREINSTLMTANNEKLERMITEMMKSLTLLKDDVTEIRCKVDNIEEQMNMQQDRQSTMQQDRFNVLQQQQQQQQNAAAFMFAAGYPSLGLTQSPALHPYQAAALAGAASLTRTASLTPQMQLPVQMPYGNVAPMPNTFVNPQLSYGNDATLLGLLQQQQQPPPPPQPMLQPPPQTQHQTSLQQPLLQTSKSSPATVRSFNISDEIPHHHPPVASFNNTPVEKGPPVNVVITSSDPLPAQNTSTNQLSFSVTIPPQHIKNNSNISLSASKANPTITAALQQPDKKTPLKADVPEKDQKTPTVVEQTSIFGKSTPTAAPFGTSTAPSFFGKSTPLTTPFATPTAQSTQSSLFSGFGSANKQESTPKAAEPAKKNIFEGFSFNTAASSKASTAAEATKPTFSFANIGQQSAAAAAPAADSNAAVNVSGGHNDEEDYEPTAHFEPVIALPDLIEVKTGEEDEIALFEHRAKLLRYVKESKEWKDRGIGNMKVLVSKSNPNKVRLLMRREQVLKLCCNQMLAKDTKFAKLPKSDTALSWYGQDYSENELQVEMLAVRFKTAEICQRFHEAILNAQKNMSDGDGGEAPATVTNTTSTDSAGQQKGFGDQFKPKAGSWTCEGCYCSNKATDTTCPACNTPKDKNAVVEPKAAAPVTSKFSFGNLPATTKAPETMVEKGFGDQFKPKAGSWTCEGCYCSNKATDITCPACNTPKDKNAVVEPKAATPVTSKFSFGNLNALASKPNEIVAVSTEAPKNDATPSNDTKNIFGTPSGAQMNFSFGNLGKTASPVASSAAVPTTATAPAATFNFEFKPASQPAAAPPSTIGSEEFSFVFKPKSPTKGKSPLKQHTDSTGVEDVSDDENVEEEENQTYFAPVIPLPDKVDVKTGEEDENELYSHRAKLFRFREAEWRERGLGNVKILQHKQTGRLRVVMRRDQILKICLNHALTHDIAYKPKDSKSWHFVANDFSEGAMELDQFCLRFKTEEVATEFKRAIDDALGGITSKQNGIGSSSEAVAAAAPRESLASKLSAEESKKITDLKLPADFFDYKTKSKCNGCRGCNSEEFVFPEVKAINMITVDENPIPLSPPQQQNSFQNISTKSPLSQKPFQNIFVQRENEATPKVESTNTTPFGKINFNTSSSESEVIKAPTFSFSTGNGKNIFGSGAEVPKTSASFSFGSTSIFGAAVPATNTTTTPSIFGGFANTSAQSVATATTTNSNVASKPLFGSTAFSTTTSSSSTNIFGGFNPAKPAESATEPVGDQPKKDVPNFTFKLSNENGVSGASPLAPASFKATSTPALNTSSTENNKSSSTTLFGASTGLSFASLAQKSANAAATVDPPASDQAPNLSAASVSQFSFATLAAQANNSGSSADRTGNPSQFNTNASNAFIGLSNRDDFSSFSGPRNNGTSAAIGANNSVDSENAVDDGNYDPHYEPIIELPDEIEVTTGEEDEKKLFGERAKLYRFDQTNKEWKERGVGEFKVLHHPANNSYRLLLRREQIHKCVLNMALSVDFQMNPMKQSDKAFCWVATNFAEDTENGVLESLSVRFRNAVLAQKFHEIVKDCLAKLKAKGELEPEDD